MMTHGRDKLKLIKIRHTHTQTQRHFKQWRLYYTCQRNQLWQRSYSCLMRFTCTLHIPLECHCKHACAHNATFEIDTNGWISPSFCVMCRKRWKWFHLFASFTSISICKQSAKQTVRNVATEMIMQHGHMNSSTTSGGVRIWVINSPPRKPHSTLYLTSTHSVHPHKRIHGRTAH